MIATRKHSIMAISAASMLLAPAARAPVAAQSAPRRPVILALPDTFPEVSRHGVDALALVYRFGGARGRADIIVLNPAHATPQALRVAVMALRRFRGKGNLNAGHKLLIPAGPSAHRGVSGAARFGAVLERLRNQSNVGGIEGLGTGRWLEFHDLDEIAGR